MRKFITNPLLPIMLLFLAIFSGCSEDTDPSPVSAELQSFRIIAPVEASGEINHDENTVTVYVPSGTALSAVQYEAEVPEGASVNPASHTSVDLSNPLQITVIGRGAEGRETSEVYTVSAFYTAPYAFVGKAATINDLEEDARAAANWMQETYGDDFVYLPASGINESSLSNVRVIFYYQLEVGNNVNLGSMSDNRVSEAISNFVRNGGQMLLAGDASQYVFNINRVPSSFAFTETNAAAGVEEDKSPDDRWGFSVVPSATSADRTGHPIFSGLLTENNRVYLNNSPTREVRLVWWATGPAGGECCGEIEMVTNFEEQLKAVKLATLRHVEDYFGFAAIEFGRTDQDTHADLHSNVPTDFQGNILVFANTIIGYEWETQDGSPNEYVDNIKQLTQNAINYLDGLYED
ncbi:DUF4960 domain-containing protein [Litoribacter populi]|uniref:DUF4960 domain-containing protein n=1 Tax=Litoribacter populi TaxID=2598460 RepID=UPI001F29F20F|nr:DUF4960 domain-containing protein [Litoribacter populi]